MESPGSKYKLLFDKGAKLVRGSIHLDGQTLPKLGFFEKVRLKKSLRYFQQAAAVAPTNGAPLLFLAKIEERLGHNDRCVDWLQKANSIEPNNLIVAIELGGAFSRQGNQGASISVLSAAIQRYPEEPRLHCNLALALLFAGDTDKSIKVFEQVVRLEPKADINKKLLAFAVAVSERRKPIPTNASEIEKSI